MLFLQGGLCDALKEECCVYVDKTGLVKDSIAKVTASLEKEKERENNKSHGTKIGFQPPAPRLLTLLPSLLGPRLGLLLLISFSPWTFQKLTRFVKSQVDSSLSSASVSVHYHRLDIGDNKQVTEEESDEDTASSPSSQGERLNFHKMLK